VIVPVHNGGSDLVRCLESLGRSTRPPDELIVVADSCTDGSAATARAFDARVIQLACGPYGPAVARNRGAEVATGDALLFLDADVTVHPDTLARVEHYLDEHDEIAALFGSYDTDSPAGGLVARYKNLSHHYVHQRSRREASTFWSGCGAIRREQFLAIGGFDESFARPSIEDIELGTRLCRAGHRVWLCADVQVTHLKRWTMGSLLQTDILNRAVPWTMLIVRNDQLPRDLNLDERSRISALAAWSAPACLGLGIWSSWGLVGMLLAMALLGVLNADLYRFFRRQGGMPFALGAAGLHALYLLYSSVTFAVIAIPAWLVRHGLALLLLATLLKGLAWSVVVPPLHANDEVPHFLYAQSVERSGSWQPDWGDSIPTELATLRDLAQLEYAIEPPRPMRLSDRAGIAAMVARLDDPAEKWTYVPYPYADEAVFRSFTHYHPPLYYILTGAVQAPLEQQSILVRLLASRWVSLLLTLATVLIAHQAGRELWPDRQGWPLLLATLVSFHPVLTFSGAVMGNQSLEIALFSACLLVCLRSLRSGLSASQGLMLGAILAAGLLTKISFLSVLPLLGLPLLWQGWGVLRGRRAASTLWPWALVLAMPVLLSGWWYGGAVQSGGDSLVASYGTITEKRGIEVLPMVVARQLRNAAEYLRMYWGHFGWNETAMPHLLLQLLSLVTAIAYWESGWWLAWRAFERVRRVPTAHLFGFLLLGCAPLATFAFYSYLDFRLAQDLGGRFVVQGRYFLPPVVAQMAWLVLGLVQPVPDRLRRPWLWLVGTGMVVLNLYALFGVIAPRYFGPGSLPQLLERAALLQTVTPGTLLSLCAAYATMSLLVVAILGRELTHDRMGPRREAASRVPSQAPSTTPIAVGSSIPGAALPSTTVTYGQVGRR
jgi:GT2 family glycosyltransferase